MRTTPPIDKRIADYSRPGLWENNIVDTYLRAAADAAPGRTAVIDRRGAWTYAQLNGFVDDLAAALQNLGIGRGDVVSWQLPNWVEAAGDIDHDALIRNGRSLRVAAVEPSANDPVLLLYTAAPKGALHTHNTLNYEIRGVIEFFGHARIREVAVIATPIGTTCRARRVRPHPAPPQNTGRVVGGASLGRPVAPIH